MFIIDNGIVYDISEEDFSAYAMIDYDTETDNQLSDEMDAVARRLGPTCVDEQEFHLRMAVAAQQGYFLDLQFKLIRGVWKRILDTEGRGGVNKLFGTDHDPETINNYMHGVGRGYNLDNGSKLYCASCQKKMMDILAEYDRQKDTMDTVNEEPNLRGLLDQVLTAKGSNSRSTIPMASGNGGRSMIRDYLEPMPDRPLDDDQTKLVKAVLSELSSAITQSFRLDVGGGTEHDQQVVTMMTALATAITERVNESVEMEALRKSKPQGTA